MASKRILKKNINQLTYELVSECLIYRHFNTGDKALKADDAMDSIVSKRNELVSKINHASETKDFKKNRAFFRDIVSEMNGMAGIMDQYLK